MALTAEERQLLRISRAKASEIRFLELGSALISTSGRGVQDIVADVCRDRVELARQFARAGDKLIGSRTPLYRSAVSRYYYAMYHLMRAVVYYDRRGDDHEAHSVLPSHTPKDFVDSAMWVNKLKDARARRNDADYDPYPRDDAEFRESADTVAADARTLEHIVVGYLSSKGCFVQ